jgi:imidazolonepropionase-like amidohydrolase
MRYSLIHNGTLIDGNGGHPIHDVAILIKDNYIIDVGSEETISIPNDKFVKIDANDGFILPGFIDAHLHLMADGFRYEDTIYDPLSIYFYKATQNMRKTIEAGVTTVRDAGLADIGVKMAVDQGLILGPRMQISVAPLSISGGHFDFWLNSGFDIKTSYPGFPDSICDGVEEVRKKVREVLRAKAEVIKVMVTGGVMSANDSPEFTQFTEEELRVIVQETKYHNDSKVMAHAHGVDGIKNALKVGIHSIEHGTYIDKEASNKMKEQGTYLVPTFVVMEFNKRLAESGQLPEWRSEEAIRIVDIHQKNIKKAFQAGVKIAMGTDSGVVAHGFNLHELGFLNDIGMKPEDTIVAATKTASECLGWEDKLGTIETGKYADIVITKTDPLADIKSLGDQMNISVVIKDGKIVKDIR